MVDIVITGIGVVSPLGVGKEAFWINASKAKSGIGEINTFDTSSFRSNVAGQVGGFDPSQFMAPGVYRRMGRVSRMAVASSVEALKDSRLNLDTVDRRRVAVIVGTSYGSSSKIEEFYLSLLNDGPRGAQPFFFPETVPNAPASHIAILHRITGPNTTFSQNLISSENAILYAQSLLLQNQADVALVGGGDELSAMQYACYDALGALNRIRVAHGEPVQPMPGGGLILGEGAGILVMERRDFATEREAEIYGVLRSGVVTGGMTSIGHYEIKGEQTGRAMSLAISRAGIEPHQVDEVHVSANFSGELERLEYNQLAVIFPERNENLRITPLKYLMGDFGGVGAIRAAAILLSLHHQTPLPTVPVEALKGGSQHLKWGIEPAGATRTVLMTSTTFGGGSTSLIFTKH
jgi:3-oxoacyl-[acyl-carrier-protein] synthase II